MIQRDSYLTGTTSVPGMNFERLKIKCDPPLILFVNLVEVFELRIE